MKNLFQLWLILFAAQLSAQYTVGTKTISYTDPARSNRSIGVDFRYPGTSTAVANGVFPFVIFGHGFSMGADSYYNYGDSLAKMGYIVGLVTTETGLGPSHPNFAQDLIFVHNKLIAEGSNSSSFFYQKVSGKGAIGGHSMGGGATVLSAQYSVPATCYFTFAAATTNPSSITAAPNLTKPYLGFAGSRDCIAPYNTNQLPHYNSAGSACKYLINITDGLHCQFNIANSACSFGEGASFCASSPLARAAQFNKVMLYLVPFLDYYLKENCSAWDLFQSRYSGNTTDVLLSSCNNVIPSNAQITGNTTPCNGTPTTLTALPAGFQYTWNDNSTSQTLQTSNSGTYSVVVGNGDCRLPSVAATVTTVFPPNAPQTVNGNTAPCAGQTIQYDVATVAGATNYTWTLPAGWSINSGSGTNSISVSTGNNSGNISVYASNNCGNSGDATVSVSISTTPATPVISGTDTLCANNNSFNFTANGSAQNTYNWLLPQGSTINNGAGTNAITASITQSGTVSVTESNTCGTSGASNFNVVVLDTLAAQIVQNGSLLNIQPSTNGDVTWYNSNGNSVGVGNNFEPANDGSYYAVVTNANGCSTTTATFNFISTSMKETSLLFKMVPNPATHHLFVRTGDIEAGSVLKFFAADGKCVLEQKLLGTDNNIDVHHLPRGVYSVSLQHSSGNATSKLILE